MPRRHTLTRQMLARAAAPLLVLGVVAGVVTPASASAGSSAGSSAARPGSTTGRTICQRRGHQAVTARRQHYVVKNDT